MAIKVMRTLGPMSLVGILKVETSSLRRRSFQFPPRQYSLGFRLQIQLVRLKYILIQGIA
jgi:hypothetical protein